MTEIRPASGNELGEVLRLLESCELPTGDLTAAHLARFLVARAGAELVGVVGIEPEGDAGLLRSLAVSKRGEGLGSRLLSAAEQAGRELGIRELYLLTTTAPGFFAKLGYSPAVRSQAPPRIRATTEFKTMCPDSAVCMRKEIGQ